MTDAQTHNMTSQSRSHSAIPDVSRSASRTPGNAASGHCNIAYIPQSHVMLSHDLTQPDTASHSGTALALSDSKQTLVEWWELRSGVQIAFQLCQFQLLVRFAFQFRGRACCTAAPQLGHLYRCGPSRRSSQPRPIEAGSMCRLVI